LELDANEQIVLHCMVGNTGLSLQRKSGRCIQCRPVDRIVDSCNRSQRQHRIRYPDHSTAQSHDRFHVEIAVTARDRSFSRNARTTVIGMVRKPRLCVFGQLTREAYRGKIVQLRAAVSAGDLTEAQLDRYDAELFACLELPA
jgi:hypothetical protein